MPSSPLLIQRHRRTLRGTLVAALSALLVAGCGTLPPTDAPPSTDPPPVAVVLTAAEPNVALPGTTVTLRGSGFVDDLELRVGGLDIVGTLVGPDALTFVVPDTSAYPVIELGEATGERLLFVGAEYTGDANTAGVQFALDALPPGIALRLPAGTITGEYLVVGERALYGSGSEAGGTRLELQGTAWLVLGADLSELHLRASQVILSPSPPADPSTPFDSLALVHAAQTDPAVAASTRVNDVAIDLADEPTTLRNALEGIAGAATVTFEDVRIEGLAVDLYVDAFVARRLTMAGPRFDVYALTTLDVSDAVIDVAGSVDVSTQDPGRYVLARVDIDAGGDVKLYAGDEDPDAVAEVSDLHVRSDEWVSIVPNASARLLRLDLAGTVVEIESGSHDLDLEAATLYADDGVRLLADNGALTLTDVDVSLGPDAADALHGLNPTSLEVRGRLGVEVRGGTWNAGPTARVGSETGTITLADLNVEADAWIGLQPEGDVTIERASLRSGTIWLLLEVAGSVAIDDSEIVADEIDLEVADGTLRLTDVHLDGDDVELVGTSAVALERATIAARSVLWVYAEGPIDVDEPSFTVGVFELFADAGRFTLRRGTLVTSGGVVLTSLGGPGLIEDMALRVRSLDGFRAASDVRLEVRRTGFVFRVPIVFEAPPGQLLLEDVTGADEAETPGQP